MGLFHQIKQWFGVGLTPWWTPWDSMVNSMGLPNYEKSYWCDDGFCNSSKYFVQPMSYVNIYIVTYILYIL